MSTSQDAKPNYAPMPIAGLTRNSLLEELLLGQKTLSAVEQFSDWHDADHQRGLAKDSYNALLPINPPENGQQYSFEVDLDACSGCKSCVVACNSLNGLDETETWRKVGVLRSQSDSLPAVQHVTTACHHCLEPACLQGCPVIAYEKDALTGIVRHLDDQCFGCKYCTMMCPYEVPQYNPGLGIVRKCDMCIDRIRQDEAPACVQACPNRAISIKVVDIKDYVNDHRNYRTHRALISTAPPSHITIPTTRYRSRRTESNELSSATTSNVRWASEESSIDAIQPGHLPLVLMLVLTQASVGMWCTIAFGLSWNQVPSNSILKATIFGWCLGVIGVHLALLHLGRPWLAFRSFLGWRTSWLSREAIVFGIYLSTMTLSVACRFEESLNGIAYAATLLTAIVGCIAVYCSAMIYVSTKRELWNSRRTFFEFVSTTICLGLAGSAFFANPTRTAVMLWAAVVVGVLSSAYINRFCRTAVSIDSHRQNLTARCGRLIRGSLNTALLGKKLSEAFAIGIAAFATLLLFLDYTAALDPLVFLVFLGLLVSQCLLRWLYFASVVFSRMPGANS